MAHQANLDDAMRDDALVALTLLFIEALNARDHTAARALVSDDAEFRGPNGSAVRGHEGADRLLDAAADVDLIVVRTASEEIEDDGGVARVTLPVREIISKDDLFRTTVFEVRDGAIAAYETLTND
jgi:ketosteroid isomerase-like protein